MLDPINHSTDRYHALLMMPYINSSVMKPATLAKHRKETAKMKKKKKLAKLSRKRNKKG